MKDNNIMLVTKKGVPQRLYLNGIELPKIALASLDIRPSCGSKIVIEIYVDNFLTLELDHAKGT